MFFHNFKYTLKTLFKSKMLIFWTYAFPLILGTFFYMAFSNIENSEKLEIISIALVETEEENRIYKEVFETLSTEGENRIFTTQYLEEKEAKNKLSKKEISGYIVLEKTPKIVVNQSGINETILKLVVEEIEEMTIISKNVLNIEMFKKMTLEKNRVSENQLDDYAWYYEIYKKVMEVQNEYEANLQDVSNANLSYTMIEFYTLISMTCLYGGILGMVVINQNMPNMSNKGKRISISPLSKGKLIFSSVFASYIVQLIGLSLLFFYTVFVLHVEYGTNLPLIILLALIGSLSGLSLGIFVASILKTNENTKTGIMISVTMFGCFLSGMMGVTMKYIVDKNFPLLNKINPASMITDGFYSLYYYSTQSRFYFNIISLLVFSSILLFFATLSLRRQKYDSI